MSDVDLSLAIKGWFLAVAAAMLVLSIFAVADIVRHGGIELSLIPWAFTVFSFIFFFIFLLTAVPSAIFIWIAYRLGLKYFIVFAGFGTALGRLFAFVFKAPPAFTWQLTAAGLVAGITYWLVAVRARHTR
ncbi:hypothetical protein [Bradyrhizobium sp.]|uniref:hypothetical protein n=1 Tax=Bradyrhizobium sp. TaxID=376 RepID=UPI002D52EBEF|nr:hypothetical protein [Bradyrhizobium sp.]HZR76476.1 hypothetical protein [Bradyrhizobium sp.]